MKLFLIGQDQHTAYDTYDKAVVAAPDSASAAEIVPSGAQWKDAYATGWCSSPKHVSVRCIGVAAADVKQGVVFASYNAG